jgi:WD40 repeat protein
MLLGKNWRALRKAVWPVLACGWMAATWMIADHGDLTARPVLAASTPDFDRDVFPILQKNCASCHSASVHKSNFVLDSYGDLMKGGKHGQAIVPHSAKDSRMVQMLEGDVGPQMPLEADPLRDADIAIIKTWIDAGAAGPKANEAMQPVAAAATPEIRPTVPVVSPVSSLKFSPDGSLLAVGGYKEVRLLDARTGKDLATLEGHADFVRSIAFSPNGKMLAAAGGEPQREGEIKVWDVGTHQSLRTMRGHKDCIYSVAWSPDGKTIASGSYDKLVKLWDPATGKEARTLQDHIDAVFAVAFSPDGKRLASASQDRTVKIWDVATGKRVYTLSDAADGLTSLAFSPSGDQVVAVGYDKTIYVWALGADDGHLVQSLIADEDSLLAVAWSPDGKRIITASSDGSIRFRNSKLDLLGMVDGQPDWVDALDLSPDGKRLAAGRYNGALSLYDAASYKETWANAMVFDPLKPARGDKTQEAASR